MHILVAFSAFTLLVGYQEEHLAIYVQMICIWFS